MYNKFANALRILNKHQKGITGLETAIILIAFVVVAAVFAYTAISAGLFATQKSQEAVYSGLNEAQSTMDMPGNVIAYNGDYTTTSSIGKVEFCVSIVSRGKTIDLTPNYVLAGGALVTSGLKNPTQISYYDQGVTIADCAWTIDWIGKHTDDYILEESEKAVITVWLHTYNGSAWASGDNPPFLAANLVDTNHTFTLEVKPPAGAVLTLQRTTPGYLDTVVDLR